MTHIRNTIESDLVDIQKIYTHYVVNTFSTFEINPPNQNELTSRWKNITNMGFPYLTAELENQVVGYTYASKYRSRSAYDYTIEDSVYVSPNFLGQGVGESLLNTLIKNLSSKQSYSSQFAEKISFHSFDSNTSL